MKLPLPTAEQLQARGEAALRPTHFASLRISLATPVSFLLVPHSCLFFFTRPPLLPRRTHAATHLSSPRTFPSRCRIPQLSTRERIDPLSTTMSDDKKSDDYRVDMPSGKEFRAASPPTRSAGSSRAGGVAITENPIAAVLAYCGSSIMMTVTNKYVLSGVDFNLNFFLLCVQV